MKHPSADFLLVSPLLRLVPTSPPFRPPLPSQVNGSYVCYYQQPGGFAPLSMTCSVGTCLYEVRGVRVRRQITARRGRKDMLRAERKKRSVRLRHTGVWPVDLLLGLSLSAYLLVPPPLFAPRGCFSFLKIQSVSVFGPRLLTRLSEYRKTPKTDPHHVKRRETDSGERFRRHVRDER